MSGSLPGTLGRVIVEDDFATLMFERFYPHSLETVWKALTEEERLAKWYLAEAQIDGKVGGMVDLRWNGSRLHVTGRVIEWSPPRVFEHEWNLAPTVEMPEGESTIVKWELSPQGSGTLLRLSHRHFSKETASGARRGFDPAAAQHAYLDRLGAFLESREMPDFAAQLYALRKAYHK